MVDFFSSFLFFLSSSGCVIFLPCLDKYIFIFSALSIEILNPIAKSLVTFLAPTGTIGLLMDCDTTGIEPEFALAKLKKLAGGGKRVLERGSQAPQARMLSRLYHEGGRI